MSTEKIELTQEFYNAAAFSQLLEKSLFSNWNTDYVLDNSYKNLSQNISELQKDLNRLLTIKQELLTLYKDLEYTVVFSNVLQDMQENVINREYFIELIETYDSIFQFLLKKVSAESQQKWEEKLSCFTNPSLQKIATHGIQYALSLLTSPITVLGRALIAKEDRDSIESTLPETDDSACKTALIHLEDEARDVLNKEIEALRQEYLLIFNRILPNQKNCSISSFSIESSVLKDSLNQFEQMQLFLQKLSNLYHRTKHNKLRLEKLKGIQIQMNEFVTAYNDFWVKLSNFFSQISSIFKSDKARKIDEIISMKHELEDLINEDETYFKNLTDNLENQSFGTFSKHQLKKQLPLTLAPQKIKIEKKNMVTFFNSIQGLYQASKVEFNENENVNKIIY